MENIIINEQRNTSIDLTKCPKFIKEYINFILTIENLSINTVTDYYIAIMDFTKYMISYKKRITFFEDNIGMYKNIFEKVNEKFYSSISKNDMYEYLSHLRIDKKNSPSTITTRLRQIKSFYTYLEEKYEIKNRIRLTKSPKQEKRQINYLTLEEAKQLIDTLSKEIEISKRNKNKNTWLKYRNLCIVILFLNCAVRRNELVNIKKINIRNNTIKVMGKGKKERTIYLNDITKDSIEQYLNHIPKNYEQSDYLFVTKKYHANKLKKMTDQSVYCLIKKSFEKAGLDTSKYAVHTLRHTSATLLYNYSNIDLRSLQEILGHSSSRTTEIYTHVNNKKIEEAISKNPLNHIGEI